jgi:hypothetical protein
MRPQMMGAPAATEQQHVPWGFIVVSIVAAVVIAAVIGYLGLSGYLGWGIVGARSPGGGVVFVPILGLWLGKSIWAPQRSTP